MSTTVHNGSRELAGVSPEDGVAVRAGIYPCTMLRGAEMDYSSASSTWHSVRPNGECTIYIVEISCDAARGVFSGTLSHFAGDLAEPLDLTDGVFHLPLARN